MLSIHLKKKKCTKNTVYSWHQECNLAISSMNALNSTRLAIILSITSCTTLENSLLYSVNWPELQQSRMIHRSIMSHFGWGAFYNESAHVKWGLWNDWLPWIDEDNSIFCGVSEFGEWLTPKYTFSIHVNFQFSQFFYIVLSRSIHETRPQCECAESVKWFN